MSGTHFCKDQDEFDRRVAEGQAAARAANPSSCTLGEYIDEFRSERDELIEENDRLRLQLKKVRRQLKKVQIKNKGLQSGG